MSEKYSKTTEERKEFFKKLFELSKEYDASFDSSTVWFLDDEADELHRFHLSIGCAGIEVYCDEIEDLHGEDLFEDPDLPVISIDLNSEDGDNWRSHGF